MNLVIIHKNKKPTTNNGNGLLRFAISTKSIFDIILHCLNENLCWSNNSFGKSYFAIPEEWKIRHSKTALKIIPYNENVPIYTETIRENKRSKRRIT